MCGRYLPTSAIIITLFHRIIQLCFDFEFVKKRFSYHVSGQKQSELFMSKLTFNLTCHSVKTLTPRRNYNTNACIIIFQKTFLLSMLESSPELMSLSRSPTISPSTFSILFRFHFSCYEINWIWLRPRKNYMLWPPFFITPSFFPLLLWWVPFSLRLFQVWWWWNTGITEPVTGPAVCFPISQSYVKIVSHTIKIVFDMLQSRPVFRVTPASLSKEWSEWFPSSQLLDGIQPAQPVQQRLRPHLALPPSLPLCH